MKLPVISMPGFQAAMPILLLIDTLMGLWLMKLTSKQVSDLAIPLLRDENIQQEINNKVLTANKKRTEAYDLEQEALTVLDEQVIYAR